MNRFIETVDNLARAGEVAAILVHLNDTYAIDEKSLNGVLIRPGLARLTRFIQLLRGISMDRCGDDRVVVVHSGDFLSPSSLGKKTHGAHMVTLLNHLPVTYYTIGNHEFDYECETPNTITDQLLHLKGLPIVCNLDHANFRKLDWTVWPADRPRFAITGVAGDQTMKASQKCSKWESRTPRDEMRRVLGDIEEKRPTIETLIVLSHMDRNEDRQLIRDVIDDQAMFTRFANVLFLGGHDHDIDWLERVSQTFWLSKNLSNARTVTVFILTWAHVFNKQLHRLWLDAYNHGRSTWSRLNSFDQDLSAYLRKHSPSRSEDAGIGWEQKTLRMLYSRGESLADQIWRLRASSFASLQPVPDVDAKIKEFMRDVSLNRESDDLKLPDLPASLVAWDARDKSLRMKSTDFGNFVADCALQWKSGQLAIITAGTFRIDATLPPRFSTEDLSDTFLYDSDKALIAGELPVRTCEILLKHGLSKRDMGAFPQLSTSQISVSSDGEILGNPADKMLLVVLTSYMLDQKDEDGYRKALFEGKALDDRKQVFDDSLIEKWKQRSEKSSIIDVVKKYAASVKYDASLRVSVLTGDIIADDLYSEMLVLRDNEYDDWYGAIVNMRPLGRTLHPENVDQIAKYLRWVCLSYVAKIGQTRVREVLLNLKEDQRGYDGGQSGVSWLREYCNALIEVIDANAAATHTAK